MPEKNTKSVSPASTSIPPLTLPRGVVVIVGPVASGKTKLAMELADSAGEDGAIVISTAELTGTIKQAKGAVARWDAASKAVDGAVTRFNDAIKQGQSVIVDAHAATTEQVYSLLNCIASAVGNTVNTSMVKLDSSYEEQLKRLQNSHQMDRTGAAYVANKSNSTFGAIMQTKFSESEGRLKPGFHLACEVKYLYNDPRPLVFEAA